MPNLNEIAKFRQELKNIAHEGEILASWGDRLYDELPPPDPAEVPDIDLDALLTTIGPDTQTDTPTASSNSDHFDTVPVTDASALPADTAFQNNFGDNTPQNTAAAPQNASDSSRADDTITKDSGSAYPVDEEGMPELDDMGTFLSSFDDLLGGNKEDEPGLSGSDDSDSFGMEAPSQDAVQQGNKDEASPADTSFMPDLDDLDFGNLEDFSMTAPEDSGTESTGFDDSSAPLTGDNGLSSSMDNDTPAALDDEDSGFSFDDDLFGSTFPADTDEPQTADQQDSTSASEDPLNFDDMLSSLNFDDTQTQAAAADEDGALDAGTEADFSMDDLAIPDIDPAAADTAFDTEPESLDTFDSLDSPGNADPIEVPDFSDEPFDVSSLSFPDNPQPDGEDSFEALEPDADASSFEIPDITDDGFSPDMPEFTDDSEPQLDTAADSSEAHAKDSFGGYDDSDGLLLYSEERDEPGGAPEKTAAVDTAYTDDPPADELPADDASADQQEVDLSSFNFTPETDPFGSSSSASPADTIPDSASSSGIPDVGFEGIDFLAQQPGADTGDQTGFSLEENPLDTDITEVSDDQFNLPDNFKEFTADAQSKMFDSVIAKSTGTTEEGDPLSISDDDYFKFLNKLEDFPFNVQLAIQNYIANHESRPEDKMNFIRYVLSGASLRKIVRKLEGITNTSIPIPRGFHRKSVEEYEREKKTFKYWFVHRFLPVAVMSGIALILIFCISVLSWQFIYKPVTSESLYKSGYAYLQNEHYETAIEKFNKAGEYKRKKRWYFAYARAFRAKKQFTSAEKMYTRLIYDFNYDKQAGLEYADMLSTDLRNYEKAETILRRRLLDQHVNDKDGLLALGDIYLNWGDEDPEKYDDAVKIYSRLIELYGENNTYLLRMMRYFIRTDNLAEVLRLKELFAPRFSKVGASDLTELSGYLLEKRYNPKPLDSETLRTQIDDVRKLLEKAVQADKTMPEAYYNLGRFFIYNNRQDGAIENLTEAIKRFKTAAPMTSRRTMQYVDSMRLLGEQFVMQKKYLDAQTLYADALTVYRNYTAFKPLPANQNIGKLYADYGDIDYFISYNFDSALDNYQHAVKELYDTPSIQYRIGYIQYQQENYEQAIDAISRAYAEKPRDAHLLYGFGNTFFKRGDYFAALSVYEQLFSLLTAQRARKDYILSSVNPDDAAFIEQYMQTANNLGATLNRLAERTGDSQKNGRSLALFAEATRAWDALTRNPQTMIRAKSVGLAYLNIQNMLNSKSPYDSEIYTDIPMILENETALEQNETK